MNVGAPVAGRLLALVVALVALPEPAEAVETQGWFDLKIQLAQRPHWALSLAQKREFERGIFRDEFLVSTGFDLRRSIGSGRWGLGYQRQVATGSGSRRVEHRWIAEAGAAGLWGASARLDARLRAEARVFESGVRPDTLRWRARLLVRRHGDRGRLRPYASTELFLAADNAPLVHRHRLVLGVELPSLGPARPRLGWVRQDTAGRRPLHALEVSLAVTAWRSD